MKKNLELLQQILKKVIFPKLKLSFIMNSILQMEHNQNDWVLNSPKNVPR